MSKYNLVSNFFFDILPFLEYSDDDSENIDSVICKTYSNYLKAMKLQIDDKQQQWDNYKKYTNPYEFIHTSISYNVNPVSSKKPLSRSFFKLIEILTDMNYSKYLPVNKSKRQFLTSFHFAEGPGGFIEAILYLRRSKFDKYYGMTLIDNKNYSIPGWNKAKNFISENSNVYIEKGITKTGDILNTKNLKYCYKKYKSSCDLVTGDGGFDFTKDFNNQEVASLKLALAQIVGAISCQKKNGWFILKVFDTLTQGSIDLLYLLSILYNNITIVKPNTSRQANSEKYIVCKNFRLDDSYQYVYYLSNIIDQFKQDKYPKSFLRLKIPYIFINNIQEINLILGQIQLNSLLQTFNIIKDPKQDRLNKLKQANIIKCINWCIKYNIPYNTN